MLDPWLTLLTMLILMAGARERLLACTIGFRLLHVAKLLASQHELARAYQADGQVKKAVELLDHRVAVHRRVLRVDHPFRLISERNLRLLRAELIAEIH